MTGPRIAIGLGRKPIPQPSIGTIMRRVEPWKADDGKILGDNVIERLERKANGDWSAPGHDYGSRGWAGICVVSAIHGWTWVLE